jgi:putative two-component system response regulator
MVVAADHGMLQRIEGTLVAAGYGPVALSTDPGRMLALFGGFGPDLVLLELGRSGAGSRHLIRELVARVPEDEFLPIVVLAAGATEEQKRSLLAMGVCDIVDPTTGLSDLPVRLQNGLRVRYLASALEQRVATRTSLLRQTELELASRLAAVAELGDYGDASHVQRVGRTAALVAAQLGMKENEVQLIRYAAPLHDIGKIAIPEAILLKTDPLTLEEWDVLKTHTTIGARLLSGSLSPVLQVAEKIALYHHECWNGTGYAGVRGEDIPLAARIVTVAEVYDALTHERPYKSAWTGADSLSWMRTMRGQRFDPRALDALEDVLRLTDVTELALDARAPLPPLDACAHSLRPRATADAHAQAA